MMLSCTKSASEPLLHAETHTNGLLNCVGAIGESINRPTILLPTDDIAAVFIAEHAKALSHWFLFPHLPVGLPRRLADKMSLHSLCRGAGIPSPEYAVPTSIDQVMEIMENEAPLREPITRRSYATR